MRILADNYPTPAPITRALLSRLEFPLNQTLVDPFCGRGQMLDVFEEAGHECMGWDLYTYPDSHAKAEGGRDTFQTTRHHWGSGFTIITNPPFSRAFQAIQLANELAPEVWMLLRLSILGSQVRAPWWRQNPPNFVWPLFPRPQFVRVCQICKERHPLEWTELCACGGKVLKGSDNSEYAWVGWNRTARFKPPTFQWLDWRDHISPLVPYDKPVLEDVQGEDGDWVEGESVPGYGYEAGSGEQAAEVG